MRPLFVATIAILLVAGIAIAIGTQSGEDDQTVEDDPVVTAAFSSAVTYDADGVTVRLTPTASAATSHVWTVVSGGVSQTEMTYDDSAVEFSLDYSSEPATVEHTASDGSDTEAASSEVVIDGLLPVSLDWVGGTFTATLDWQTYSTFRWRQNPMPDISAMLQSTDAALDAVTAYLAAYCAGMTDDEKARTILDFVQDAISYETDEQSRGSDEWYKYPYETLFDGTGDCEDTSVLFVTIARALGLDAVLVSMDGHMAAAVTMTECTGTSYELDGKTYWYCETSVDSTDLAVGVDVLGRTFVELIS